MFTLLAGAVRRCARGASISSCIIAGSFAVEAGADTPDTDRVIDQVVVTASGFEQKITDAPASISVIDHEELARKPYASLVDALRGVEGIDVALEAPDKNGMGSISMRGMPSEYTLVLIDGRRQSNVCSLYPNNFGGGQFSYLPPLDAVERIEVVRGPMSTLYGSDAMGGVVNIITRKISNDWRAAFTYGGTLQQESEFGNDSSADLYINSPLIEDKLGVTVRGSYYDRDESIPDWEPLPLPSPPNDPGSVFERSLGFGGGGKQVANTNWNGGFRLSFTPNENHDFLLDYEEEEPLDWTRLFRAFKDAFDWALDVATQLARDYPEEVDAVDRVRRFMHKRIAGQLAHVKVEDILFTFGLLIGAIERDLGPVSNLGPWFAAGPTALFPGADELGDHIVPRHVTRPTVRIRRPVHLATA